jgi:hypothetical protein
MKKLLIILFSLFLSNAILSQYHNFTSDPEEYFKDAEAYLAYVNKSDAKEFMKEFELVWFGTDLTPGQRAQVYTTSNLMSEKKLKPYPDFKNYLSAIINFVSSGKTNDDFNAWHETVIAVLDGNNKKRTSKYLETCNNLFDGNVIFKSSSTTWKSHNNRFKFTYDKEPIIVFEEMNLKCYSKNDSAVLYNTTGVYYPMTSTWMGNKGRLTWERAGLAKEEVYAEIKDYKISMKSAGFTADSALFSSKYFKEPILGKISENVLSNRGSEKVTYPSFESYDKRLLIKNIFEDVDYEGGFTIRGQNLLGAGTNEELAKVIFHYKGKEFIVSESIIFTINADNITAKRAKIKLFIEEDSITHPGISFTYNNNSKKLGLVKGSQGISISPYHNTYHNLDMYFEALTWKVGDPVLEFGALFGSSDTSANFESFNYYDKEVYDRLSGLGNNPLVMFKLHAKKMKSNILEVADLATSMRKTISGLEPMLYELTILGFISYDQEKQLVYIKEKLYQYIDARKKKRDYDVLDIKSSSQKNASLNLTTHDLLIRGVRKATLSDAQYVKIFPKNRELIVKKNRNIQFEGIINAGRTEYFGKNFTFNYDDFKLYLIECDSMRIRVENLEDPYGRPQRLFSTIEGVRGEIEIDDGNNKSGIDTSKHEYPILNCTKKTYVFYDKDNIQKGAYKRDVFKFIIEPFVMDSLDNFSNQGLAFDGTFVSSGIFPEFEEKLRLQEDYSLGFIRETPSEGFKIYGDKATYDNEIRLSNKGLQGTGEINFLTSHAVSDEITFLPESVKALAQEYTNDRQEADGDLPEIPLVKGVDVSVVYIPKEKVLYAESKESHLNFFDNADAELEGKLALRPEGMTGEGTMFFGKATMLSYGYRYGLNVIDADTSEFKVLTNDLSSTAFKTTDVNSHVDFVSRLGEFKSNNGSSVVEFPENQYVCYMDVFKWKMETGDIDMESSNQNLTTIDSDLELTGSNFFSTHPDQDSLEFKSPKATFDIKQKKLICEKIIYVNIADARIYPDSGRVVIRKKAKMETLENAEIIANNITKYHEIYDGTVEIKAKNDYTASGYYNYIDEVKNEQKIYFSNIHPDTTHQTYAKGTISDKAGFKLSPQFEYNGEVEMFAAFKELSFKGETRIAHDCNGLERSWMSFEAALDPANIFIPVAKELNDIKGNPIGAGLVMNNDSIALYSTFLSKKDKKTHIDVMTADGFLHYDKNTKEYQISNMDKLKEKSLPGKYVSLNVESCKLQGDGEFNFGANLDQVELLSIGEIDYNPIKAELKIKSSVSVKFPFNNIALDKMAKHISEYPGLSAFDLDNSTYEKSLREQVDLEVADKVVSDLTIHGKVKKFPEALETQINLADIRFKWEANRKAYVSYGDIGIANLNKKQVYKYVRGKVVIYKGRTGDKISIFLQMDENNFYYFSYTRGLMSTYSTNEDFNTVILETKKEKTKFKGAKGVEDYTFQLSTKTKAVGFRRSFD